MEPVVSIAAGLRHALAATRKFFSYLLSLIMQVEEESKMSYLLLL